MTDSAVQDPPSTGPEVGGPKTASTGLANTGGAAPFSRRHNGPSQSEVDSMLATLGLRSLYELIEQAVPEAIRLGRPLELGHGVDRGLTEHQALARMRELGRRNQVLRSFLGMGYSDTLTPPVIQRSVLENPGWYTAYTPYQAEIAQGRLEALLNFQTVVIDLTGLEIANASLLDEATAAAEAMSLCFQAARGKKQRFVVSDLCHPQTIEVVQTRARPLKIEVAVVELEQIGNVVDENTFGLLLQYPATDGRVLDYRQAIEQAHVAGVLVTLAADPLALALLTSPGELGADVAIGSTQRFGMPMGYGGPHAAYMATRESLKRLLPGRVVGVSKDATGEPALRLALQTREQHIRRDRATSNICTAQVLPAVVASMYAVYHGPEGLRAIAERIHALTASLAAGIDEIEGGAGRHRSAPFFDTLAIELGTAERERAILATARERGMNFRGYGNGAVGISLDETATEHDVDQILAVFADALDKPKPTLGAAATPLGSEHRRSDAYLTHPVFSSYRSETELLRYLHRLESRDLSLTTSMIPLGSCTMKLNAAAEMMPISWPELAGLHPFAPADQALGYHQLFRELEDWLCAITGFAGISLQPNAGSQGELAGLLVIRRCHRQRDDRDRTVCLIPTSAHGTNPASAVMAGMKVVAVRCDDSGNIDLEDLKNKAVENAETLAALMITYPSTHGVFEDTIREICDIVHENGGLVYLDGANLNAQVGLCRPADYGADVCHLNLHKTFCIPHGGGGPGMGPIGVVEALKAYLPGHRTGGLGDGDSVGAISAAPYGSPAILPISWAYIAMMGSEGLTEASRLALLNANYMAARLGEHYPVLYRGRTGLVAHECILDLRPLKAAGIEVDDVAKRLMDYGFHAPTVSWPVAGTVMVEPTESESKAELDRFCEAMIQIRHEVAEIESGAVPVEDSVLRRAPHTAFDLASEPWGRPYSRHQAAFPSPSTQEHKYWPPVSRIENAYGDRNFVCSCAGMETFLGDQK